MSKVKNISTKEAKKIAMKDITKDSSFNYVYMEKSIINKCGNNCKDCKCNG